MENLSFSNRIRNSNWFKPADPDKDKNRHVNGEVDAEDAVEVLNDMILVRVKTDEDGRKGTDIIKGYMKVTSNDGVTHIHEVIVYTSDMKKAVEQVKAVQALSIQIHDSSLGEWLAEGTFFQRASPLGGGQNQLTLNRYDGQTRKWAAVSSKDRWGIQPTLTPFGSEEPYFCFTFHTDALVETNGYNKGTKGGPWDKWPTWNATKPIWESHLGKSKYLATPKDAHWSKDWGLWLFRSGATLIDFPINTTQKLIKMGCHAAKGQYTQTMQAWSEANSKAGKAKVAGITVLKIPLALIILPVLGVKEVVSKVGQVALWGVAKMAIPAFQMISYKMNGCGAEQIASISEQMGIHVYTQQRDIDRRTTVLERLAEKKAGEDLLKEWLQYHGSPTETSHQLIFETDNYPNNEE